MKKIIISIICIIPLLCSCSKVTKKVSKEVTEEIGEKFLKNTPFAKKVAKAVPDLPNNYFKYFENFSEKERKIFGEMIEKNPQYVALKMKENPNFLKGWTKLKNTPFCNNPKLVNFFGADNLQNVKLKAHSRGLSVFDENKKLLGEIDVDNRIITAHTIELPANSQKATVKHLNPIINPQYIRGANPELAGTLPPNYLFKILDKGRKKMFVQTDHLGRPKKIKAYPQYTQSGIRNEKEQVMSKHLWNGRDADEGGHLLASSLGGIAEAINYLPMKKQINQSGGLFFKFEEKVRKALKSNKKVYYEITPSYIGNEFRPSGFHILLSINRIKTSQFISNL